MGATIYSHWQETVQKKGKATGLHIPNEGSTVSFRDIYARVQANRNNPAFRNITNRIVAIQLVNSSLWLEAFLTCQAMEAIAMPLDPDVPTEGVRSLCEYLRPALLWNAEGIQTIARPSRRKPACLIKLTSGSTGQPRPLFFGDEEMLADGENIISSMAIGASDINLAAIPFGHSYGLGNLVMPLIIQGTSIAISNDPFPHSLGSCIRDTEATVFPAVPPLLRGLVQADVPRRHLASIRLFISAGSPLASRDAVAFASKYGHRIHNFYGSSETGGISYDRTGDDTLTGQSVGQPLDNVQIARQENGRLLVAGKAVIRRGNPRRLGELAAYLLTDMGQIRKDGSVVLMGRKSRMVKLAGRRLNLVEVENAILSCEGVETAYVTTYRGKENRFRLVAAIVGEAPIEQLKESLKALLPGWKIPSKWVRLENFPITARGKVDLCALEARINPPSEQL